MSHRRHCKTVIIDDCDYKKAVFEDIAPQIRVAVRLKAQIKITKMSSRFRQDKENGKLDGYFFECKQDTMVSNDRANWREKKRGVNLLGSKQNKGMTSSGVWVLCLHALRDG